VKGFRKFLFRGNVIDLAVAVVIGTAFTAVVTAVVKDLLTPLIGIFGSGGNFANKTFTIHKSKFLYGDVINAIISFVVVAAVVYFVVVLPLAKLAERKARGQAPVEDAPAISDEVKLLTEIRDLLTASAATSAGPREGDPTVAAPAPGGYLPPPPPPAGV
jgi:large conductance mechanosensitive channel